jgi:hypothetical protein
VDLLKPDAKMAVGIALGFFLLPKALKLVKR